MSALLAVLVNAYTLLYFAALITYDHPTYESDPLNGLHSTTDNKTFIPLYPHIKFSIISFPSAVRYRHPQFPRRSYASAVPWMPHSDRY